MDEVLSDDVQRLVEHLEQMINTRRGVEKDRLLPERILTEQLGTSRRKLRMAVTVLERKGLVSRVARSGTYITVPGQQMGFDFGGHEQQSNVQVMQTRLGLEPVAAQVASRVASRSDLLTIFRTMSVFKQRVRVRISADDADADFHMAIVKASHNPYIMGMMMMVEHLMRTHYAPFRQQMLRETQLAEAFLAQHEAIYTAIRRHDAKMAAVASRDHLLFAMETFEAICASADASLNKLAPPMRPKNSLGK